MRDKNKPIITSTFPYMQYQKGNPRGCTPIFVPLNRQTIYYIPKWPRILGKIGEKGLNHKNIAVQKAKKEIGDKGLKHKNNAV